MIFVLAYLAVSGVASLVLIAACVVAKRTDNRFLDEEPYGRTITLRTSAALSTSRSPLTEEPLPDAAHAAPAR